MHTGNQEQARENMAIQQIRPWDVHDERVLEVVRIVPREHFVPKAYSGLAFADTEVPLGHNQAMMPPRLEARMLQALDIQPSEKVLEIGTGSGFVTACMARLGNSVTSFEIIPELSQQAQNHLTGLGINNVKLSIGNGLDSELHQGAKYDVIAVTGSLIHQITALENLLSENGRMFLIEGSAPVMEAILVSRMPDGEIERQKLFETYLPSLQQNKSTSSHNYLRFYLSAFPA